MRRDEGIYILASGSRQEAAKLLSRLRLLLFLLLPSLSLKFLVLRLTGQFAPPSHIP
jgi:hypothetical protein